MNTKFINLYCVVIVIALVSCATGENKGTKEASKSESTNLNGEHASNFDQLLSHKLENALGRPTKHEFTHKKSLGPWTFVCGRPLEISGKPFDYKNSNLSEAFSIGLGDDLFCALMKSENSRSEVVEFDIGSNDMPVLEWVETHGVSAEILED